jgi:hypothetical protein
VAIAAVCWLLVGREAQKQACFLRLVGAGLAAAAAHLLLDLCANTGIALLWPFPAGGRRFCWNLSDGLDGFLLAILIFCAFLPALLSLVTEEIGAQSAAGTRPGRAWGVAAILLASLYLGGRALLHDRATSRLSVSRFHDRAALHWAAFPAPGSLFIWRGVVETEATIEEIDVPLREERSFDPDRARSFFKPEPSSVLDAVAATPLARAFTGIARFPTLSIERTAEGYHAELRDIGDSPLHTHTAFYLAAFHLDENGKVLKSDLRMVSAKGP